MDLKVINGKALAKKHEGYLRKKLLQIKKDRNPAIVSFCNSDDPPSVKYTFMKLQKAMDLGLDFIAEEFSATTPHEYLVEMVSKYGNDKNIDGIMVQLPLPDELNVFKKDLIDLIPKEKDVDGLKGDSFLPATVRAILTILDEEVSGWQEKKVAIVGSEGEVGKPLSLALHTRGVKAILVDKDKGSFEELKGADIVISATGQEHLIKPQMLKERVILIDVGLGDFDPDCYKKSSRYTPVLGGVGPMTVISLMENVVESYSKRI